MWKSMQLPDTKALRQRVEEKIGESVRSDGGQLLVELDHALDDGTLDADDILSLLKSHGITTGTELARQPRQAAHQSEPARRKAEEKRRRPR